MEKIAQETEEDYQKLIKLLEKFNVKVLRIDMSDDFDIYKNTINSQYRKPLMCPRDDTAMVGSNFYMPIPFNKWDRIKTDNWPINAPVNNDEFNNLPLYILDELKKYNIFHYCDLYVNYGWNTIYNDINQFNNVIFNDNNISINTSTTTRIGKDLYFGTKPGVDIRTLQIKYSNQFPEYRCHVINIEGHTDATFCPVVPGLIVSLKDIPTYEDTFPDWEVIYLPDQSWNSVTEFLKLKSKNNGKWWVPGEELNGDFTDFVETWLNHWVGYVEETVFDVNMLVIDEKNVICNNYNEQLFKVFNRYGITPHVINFRHRYFWDGGLHCITSDIHREGTIKDYFPNRNQY